MIKHKKKKPGLEVVSKAKTRQGRYVLKDGTWVPGVTTVLGILGKPALLQWANKIGIQGYELGKYVDELAEIGSLAHSMIEKHLQGLKIEPELFQDASPKQFQRATNSFRKYLDWEKQHKVEVVLSEKTLVSEERKYGGTADALLLIDGVPTLTEFKTGRKIYEDHLYQCAANLMLMQENGYTVDAIRVLQIGRSEEEGFTEMVLPTQNNERLEKYKTIFLATLEIYKIKKEIDSDGI